MKNMLIKKPTGGVNGHTLFIVLLDLMIEMQG